MCKVNNIIPCMVTARKRSLGQGNIFTPVCHSVHRGGLPQSMLGYHTPDHAPPGTMHTPPRTMHTPLPWDHAPRRPCTSPRTMNCPGIMHPPDHDPPAQNMLGDMVNTQAVRILLECNLVNNFGSVVVKTRWQVLRNWLKLFVWNPWEFFANDTKLS